MEVLTSQDLLSLAVPSPLLPLLFAVALAVAAVVAVVFVAAALSPFG